MLLRKKNCKSYTRLKNIDKFNKPLLSLAVSKLLVSTQVMKTGMDN